MSGTTNTRLLFRISAVVEILTGFGFLAAPALIIGLLLGEGVSTVGIAVARVLGIGLLSVGVAAWEPQEQSIRLAPRAGLCIYNVGVAALLAIVGSTGGMHAPLLWPAVGLHGLIGALMLWVISMHYRNNNS